MKSTPTTIKKILKELPDRYKDILIKRYGLEKGVKRHTLESIGQDYSITRERVRQIENAAKKSILETEVLLNYTKESVKKLKQVIDTLGGVITEQDILNHFTTDEDEQDHIHFLLNLSEPFFVKQNKNFKDKIWYTKEKNFEAFEKSLDHLYKNLNTNEILTEKEILNKFIDGMKPYTNDKKLLKLKIVKRLIEVSKKIGSNKIGNWGLAKSKHINLKSARDYAYLVLKEKANPLHFRKIAESIQTKFDKKINVATVHNELIKDKRFILVGRGEYGLDEWGDYSGGTVADVIKKVLKDNKKAMDKNEIVEKVLEQKNVRKQTILINLSKKDFRRTKDGKYALVK